MARNKRMTQRGDSVSSLGQSGPQTNTLERGQTMTPSETMTMTVTAAPKTKPVAKSGISLESFEQVSLYKNVPVIEAVKNLDDAKSRVNGDESRLFEALTIGLQEIESRTARESETGWKLVDENGKQTDAEFTGTLVSTEILNPVISQLAKNIETTVKRDGADVEITWEDCQSAEEKRACKENAMEALKSMPVLINGLKRRMANAAKAGN